MLLNCDADVNLPEEYGRNIYRIAQEALSNVSRHASASEVRLDISKVADKFLMTITDNGIGFDPGKVSDSYAVGLIGMRERAHLICAKLEVTSKGGSGTSVRLEVPFEKSGVKVFIPPCSIM